MTKQVINNSTIDLLRLKEIELNIVVSFLEICKKHDLKYYMLGGTCLGAVRHSGFIPWDDDIDVGMPRADYQRFLNIAQSELPENIFLQTFETDPEYLQGFAKLRDSSTTFLETSSSFLNINHGVFIDIFPLDGYKKSRISTYKRKLYASRISQEFLYNANNKKTLKYILAKILVGSSKRARNKMDKLAKKYPFEKCDTVANYYGAWGNKEIMPKEVFSSGTQAKFEGLDVIIPKNYDEYLTRLYGNYMQFPPVEKRVTHHYTEIVDFDTPYIQYVKSNKKEK